MLEKYEHLITQTNVDVSLRPIIACFAGRGLTDFIHQNVLAAFVARRFSIPNALGLFRERPAYRRFIVDCNPHIGAMMTTPPEAPHDFPLDWFDVGVDAPSKCPDALWYERGFHSPKLILAPTMLRGNAARIEGLAEDPPLFLLPEKHRDALDAALVRVGLAPDRWHACVHALSPNAAPSVGEDRHRAVDPTNYIPMIRRIVEEQGGRVVRLAAPGDPLLPDMEGVIDCARMNAPFEILTAILARGRYFIGSDAAPLALASAFGVPSAGVDLIGVGRRIWNRGDIAFPKRIILDDGREVGAGDAFEAGYLEHGPPLGARFVDSGPEALCAVADAMHDRTEDCQGWRPLNEYSKGEPTEKIAFPLPERDSVLIRIWG